MKDHLRIVGRQHQGDQEYRIQGHGLLYFAGGNLVFHNSSSEICCPVWTCAIAWWIDTQRQNERVHALAFFRINLSESTHQHNLTILFTVTNVIIYIVRCTNKHAHHTHANISSHNHTYFQHSSILEWSWMISPRSDLWELVDLCQIILPKSWVLDMLSPVLGNPGRYPPHGDPPWIYLAAWTTIRGIAPPMLLG